MDAVRLKRARRRMRAYFLGSGVVLACLYLIGAAFLIRIIGVEMTRYWSTVMMAAGVMLGGTYGFVLFASLVIHIVRRLGTGRPVMDPEDQDLVRLPQLPRHLVAAPERAKPDNHS